jgi:hypothetical protein
MYWKAFEGSGNGLTEVLSWHLPWGTEKNHEKSNSKQLVSSIP